MPTATNDSVLTLRDLRATSRYSPIKIRVPVRLTISHDTLADVEPPARGKVLVKGSEETRNSAIEIEIDLPALISQLGRKAFKNRNRKSVAGFITVKATEKLQ